MEEGGCYRLIVIPAVIRPGIAGIVLNGVLQEPHLSARPSDKLLHDAVFEKRGFKGALLRHAAIGVLLARGSRPDLRDIAVHRRKIDQRGFGRNDAPLRIVDQRVRGHVEAKHTAILRQRVFLQLGAQTVECSGVKILLQTGRHVLPLGRCLGILPVFLVKELPFALECLGIARSHPEFRLLQMDRLHTVVDSLFEIVGKIA